MRSIVLINMPFGSLRMPSLGLAQIKSVLDRENAPGRSCRVLYLNHDFAGLLGVKTYEEIADDLRHHNTGFGDWFFRQVAFPAVANNADQYMRRFYWQRDDATARFKKSLLGVRNDLASFFQMLIAKYDIAAADVVGFTSMFQQSVASLAMARLLKSKKPDLVTVMGGANCETPMGDVIARRYEFMDYVVSGAGLVSFPKLVRALSSSETKAEAGAIPGVLGKTTAVRGAGSAAAPQPALRRGALIDQAPEPPKDQAYGEELDIDVGLEVSHDDFFASLDGKFAPGEISPTLTFETSRGCWWGAKCQCTFCGMNGARMSYRAMRPDLAIQQFQRVFGYANRCSGYLAVDNIMPRNYLEDVLRKITVPQHVSIMYEVKADLDLAELQGLADANVKVIQPGIESLATASLKLMKKGTTAFRNIGFLQNCLVTNIVPVWNLLIGFPGEPESVYERYVRLLPLLYHLPPPSGCYPVRFDRYSVYYAQMERHGLDLAPVDYYEYLYPWSRDDLFHLAYYFTDRNMAQSQYFNSMIRHYDPIISHVETWRRRWRENDRPRLALSREGGATVAIDSRAGRVTRQAISATAERMLDLLHSPKGVNTLRNEMNDLPADEVAREFAGLVGKGFVFEEDERYISLVTPASDPRGLGSSS